MARAIKQGQSIYIPFINGESVFDSQNRPRMYKSVEQFKKSYPVFRLEKPELVEYAPVVHSVWIKKTVRGSTELYCKHCGDSPGVLYRFEYCPNCGARMDGGQHD